MDSYEFLGGLRDPYELKAAWCQQILQLYSFL